MNFMVRRVQSTNDLMITTYHEKWCYFLHFIQKYRKVENLIGLYFPKFLQHSAIKLNNVIKFSMSFPAVPINHPNLKVCVIRNKGK